jgi:hypothetical protein
VKKSAEVKRIEALQAKETPEESIERRQLVTLLEPNIGERKARVNWAACGAQAIDFAEAFARAVLSAARRAKALDVVNGAGGIPGDRRSLRWVFDIEVSQEREATINWRAIGAVDARDAADFGQELLNAVAHLRAPRLTAPTVEMEDGVVI